jgi:glycosyltransferase involved in cell wall biosynthesis
VILFLHNRYRVVGGEERAVQELLGVVRDELGEPAELLERPATVSGARAAAGLLRGGLDPGEVGDAVRRTGARVVHVHNLLPTLGWRALAAARAAGARIVLHLHNYRLVCAVGVCFTEGEDCTRCHGRDTRPGVRHRCRGSLPEAAVYAAAIAAQQRRIAAQADHVVVPSAFARDRLLALGAQIDPARVTVVPHVVRDVADAPRFDPAGPALVASRLAAEKGVGVAIDACRAAGRPLLVAGDGPLRAELEAAARGADVRFLGQVGAAELAALRAQTAVALVPSRSAETFGLAAAEAMAAGLPVIASAIGALPELVGDAGTLVEPGDAAGLAAALAAPPGADAAAHGLERVRERCSPDRAARALAAVYDAA